MRRLNSIRRSVSSAVVLQSLVVLLVLPGLDYDSSTPADLPVNLLGRLHHIAPTPLLVACARPDRIQFKQSALVFRMSSTV